MTVFKLWLDFDLFDRVCTVCIILKIPSVPSHPYQLISDVKILSSRLPQVPPFCVFLEILPFSMEKADLNLTDKWLILVHSIPVVFIDLVRLMGPQLPGGVIHPLQRASYAGPRDLHRFTQGRIER